MRFSAEAIELYVTFARIGGIGYDVRQQPAGEPARRGTIDVEEAVGVEEDRQVAIGGVQYRGGCLLASIVPLKVAGVLIVTTRRITFEPILFYKLVTRRFDLDLDQVSGAEAVGGNVQMNVWDLVSIGKLLTVNMKNGASFKFRSMQADELAEAINGVVRRGRS